MSRARHALHLEEPPPLGFVARYSVAMKAAEMGLRPIVGRTEGRNFIPALPYRHGLPSDDPTFAAKMLTAHRFADRLGLIMGACKASNVFGLDVDRGHAEGVDGFRELRAWLDERGVAALPRGPRWFTPRRGLQMLFRAPPGIRIRNMSGRHALAPSVDLRGHNGLMTIPPTERDDGTYQWCGGLGLFEIAIPDAPDWLLDAVQYREPEPLPAPEARKPLMDPAARDAEDRRRRRYLEQALDAIVGDVATAAPGARNSALFQAAATVAAFTKGERGMFNEDVMLARLREACQANGLLRDDGPQAINRTIRSGLTRGREGEPRRIPPPQTMQRQPARADAAHSR